MQPTVDALYYGDCLDWMAQWDDQAVDLIYLDPPFNSQANYNMLYGQAAGGAQYRAFADTWTWDSTAAERMDTYRNAIARPAHGALVGLERILGPSGMLAYLTYMAERLEHCHRLLKPTGSLYLHCDPTASHYLKIVLDGVFGARGFMNELSWKRTTTKGTTAKALATGHGCGTSSSTMHVTLAIRNGCSTSHSAHTRTGTSRATTAELSQTQGAGIDWTISRLLALAHAGTPSMSSWALNAFGDTAKTRCISYMSKVV